jgi:hypothetical protein
MVQGFKETCVVVPYSWLLPRPIKNKIFECYSQQKYFEEIETRTKEINF